MPEIIAQTPLTPLRDLMTGVPGRGIEFHFMTAKRKDDLGPRGILTRPVKKTVHPFGDSGNAMAAKA